MREKIKKILIGYLPGFITGLIICGCVSVIAATYFPSNQTTYDNSVTGLKSENVQDAIDELYGVCFPSAGDQIIEDAGLEKDPYEDRYFFTGADPNNYIIFSGETWRILSIESDNKIKIVKDESIGDFAWDTSGGTYGSNNWARPATLNTYLNKEYKNILQDKDKIVAATWSIGSTTQESTDLALSILDEQKTTWQGDIALISASEYIRTNSNTSKCGSMSQIWTTIICQNTTWLYDKNIWWTITANINSTYNVFAVGANGYFYNYIVNNNRGVRPALYLSSEVKITGGDGSQSNPYTIE